MDIWAIRGAGSRDWQTFLPNFAIVFLKQKPPNLARSGGLMKK
jgi:hypothetical protein